MYILDSDVLSVVTGSRTNEHVLAWYKSIDETDIYLSVIAITEQAKNAARLRKKRDEANAERVERTLQQLKRLFSGRILPLDASASEEWGRMLGQREANILDTAIAAIAKQGGFTIATRNVDDFEERGVKVIDPFKKPPRQPEAD